MKTCFKCHVRKPLSEFYAHPRMKDGRLNKCKSCTKANALVHRIRNIDRISSYESERAQLPHRRLAKNKWNKNDKRCNPQKWRARSLVRSAIKSGKLKPKPCEVCGNPAEAHHHDYSKPLDVQWLCIRHHKEQHRKFNYASLIA